jgi:hypothetical protein
MKYESRLGENEPFTLEGKCYPTGDFPEQVIELYTDTGAKVDSQKVN